MGPDLAGPVLLAHGSIDQQHRWLPRIVTGEDLWCQLFSEPEAGSDLASLRSRAVPDGTGWIVEGRKVWSSGAAVADMGLLLARTGDDRFALSMFAVPMSAAGIQVRPLRQMDGEAAFNEVTLDGVRLDAGALIGAPGDGWKLAMGTLGSERLTLGAQAVALRANLDDLLSLAAARTGCRRQEAAHLWSRIWLLGANFERLLASGRSLDDPSFSLLKLAASESQRDLVRWGVGLLGLDAAATADGLPAASRRFLAQPGQTIAGGTSEIQRNILAERVLGLPR